MYIVFAHSPIYEPDARPYSDEHWQAYERRNAVHHRQQRFADADLVESQGGQWYVDEAGNCYAVYPAWNARARPAAGGGSYTEYQVGPDAGHLNILAFRHWNNCWDTEIIPDGWKLREKPDPDKQFPHRVEFRMGELEKEALDSLVTLAGNEDVSELLRRLIRNEYAREKPTPTLLDRLGINGGNDER